MTPIERAAHALRLADNCDFHNAENKDYHEMVRAVLQAIREPSKEMIRRGHGHSLTINADFLWKAMIDAALAEEAHTIIERE